MSICECTLLSLSAKGIHIQQKLSGCELIDSETPGPIRIWDAFNGVNNAEALFSMQQKSCQTESLWPSMFTSIERSTFEFLFANVYSPMCIKTLRNCLHMRKKDVMRKGKTAISFVSYVTLEDPCSP